MLFVCHCCKQGTLLASFREESKARLKVLQKLGHVSADGTVLLKGRAACEIDTADELLTVGEFVCWGPGKQHLSLLCAEGPTAQVSPAQVHA